ncbi:hypothetical protein K505DRAFT_414624 [Melanomma pulvis-pyrius CBS 109.77]|uniref:Actin-like ATPase domain-containing protein n=1 Tax=Melanomma pulvis-pyrius CBS 109.77 TaxID=1314802 RepID=A0A6A6XND9_9PLEO|nr:hypothetical protein K505DRAFT_414624 [Melanomma pulvis-pyrius CBS 109.77]
MSSTPPSNPWDRKSSDPCNSSSSSRDAYTGDELSLPRRGGYKDPIPNWIAAIDFGSAYSAFAFIDTQGEDPATIDPRTNRIQVGHGYSNDGATTQQHFHTPASLRYQIESGKRCYPKRKIPRRTLKYSPLPEKRMIRPSSGWELFNRVGKKHDPIHKWFSGHITTPKSLLGGKYLLPAQHHPDNTVRLLGNRKIIHYPTDIVEAGLVALLDDINAILKRHGFKRDHSIQFSLSYPLTWKVSQVAKYEQVFAAALQKSSFDWAEGSFYLVHEAECAWTYILTSLTAPQFTDKMIFAVFDWGGGSGDMCVNRIKRRGDYALMDEEVIAPQVSGLSIGGQDFNNALELELRERLSPFERQLVRSNVTFEGIIQGLLHTFEREMKGAVDFERELEFYVDGLEDGVVRISVEEQHALFDQLISSACEFIVRHIEAVRAKGFEIDKLFLSGGTSRFHAFRLELDNLLVALSPPFNVRNIMAAPVSFTEGCIDVARGLAQRTLLKNDLSIRRFTQINAGVIRHLDTSDRKDERALPDRPVRSPNDGWYRVMYTIDWKILKGHLYDSEHAFVWESQFHFSTAEKQWIAREEFYISEEDTVVSDKSTRHPANKGAIPLGIVSLNVTELKNDRLVQLTIPGEGDLGIPHYRVNFRIECKIMGRNLNVCAKWPHIGPEQKRFREILPFAAAFRACTA